MLFSVLRDGSMSGTEKVLSLLILLFCVLLSLTVHELFHGLAALWMGDKTAKSSGRLTLNPLHHLEPMGALCLFLFAMPMTGGVLRWYIWLGAGMGFLAFRMTLSRLIRRLTDRLISFFGRLADVLGRQTVKMREKMRKYFLCDNICENSRK